MVETVVDSPAFVGSDLDPNLGYNVNRKEE